MRLQARRQEVHTTEDPATRPHTAAHEIRVRRVCNSVLLFFNTHMYRSLLRIASAIWAISPCYYHSSDLNSFVRPVVCKSFPRSLLAKVKVTTYLVFPDALDMSSYTGDPSMVYQLQAVIVHCGPSAYSGHYIAHIKDPKVGDSLCTNQILSRLPACASMN